MIGEEVQQRPRSSRAHINSDGFDLPQPRQSDLPALMKVERAHGHKVVADILDLAVQCCVGWREGFRAEDKGTNGLGQPGMPEQALKDVVGSAALVDPTAE